MMDDVVKRFIEDSIDVIEENKWFMLFMGWYTNPHKEFPDSLQFRELMDILSTVDKEIYPHTKTHRQGVIITITRATIEDIRKNIHLWTNDGTVSLDYLLLDLYSTLGLSKEDIVECIMDAAKYEGLIYDPVKEEFSGLKKI